MGNVADNLGAVRRRVEAAVTAAGRGPESVTLLAVSKKKPAEMIREAFDAGQRAFGENYAQEFRDKAEALSDLDIEWHFIGHLQRNKVKYVVPYVSCIHSIDSLKLAEEVNKRAPGPIDCFIELDIAGEATKTGMDRGELESLVQAIAEMPNLNLRGLMTMPPYDIEPETARPYFVTLRETLNGLNEKSLYPEKLTGLSMGMTGDLEVAIKEGSTIVRVGTAIFGER